MNKDIKDTNDIKRDFSPFISKSPSKTPPGRVFMYDWIAQKYFSFFDVPAGFQLERYVMHLYADNRVDCKFSEGQYEVTVLNIDTEPQVSFVMKRG